MPPVDDVLEQVAVVARTLQHEIVPIEPECSTADSTQSRAWATQESEEVEK